MSCNYPLIRAETFETYTNQKGKLSYKAEFIPRDEFDKDFKNNAIKMGMYRRVTPVGCGQCVGCKLDYSRDRATQMMMEKEYGYHEQYDQDGKPLDKGHKYPDGTCWFLTCTYDDEHLKTHKYVSEETGESFEGISLDMEDNQKFIRALRYRYPQMQIKYVCAGEYGSTTHRPHLHYIIYGLPLDQTEFKTAHTNGLGQRTWKSKTLEKIWGNGYVEIGRVDWRSCAYVARYTLKKAFGTKDKKWYKAQGMLPEFICWSNNVGLDFFREEENIENLYKRGTVPISSHMGGLLKIPKTYDRMIKEIDPNLWKKISKKRQQQANNTELILRSQTDLTPEERRQMQEARMKSVMKDLRTEV